MTTHDMTLGARKEATSLLAKDLKCQLDPWEA
jgi:hypothetical protein